MQTRKPKTPKHRIVIAILRMGFIGSAKRKKGTSNDIRADKAMLPQSHKSFFVGYLEVVWVWFFTV
jgi:hypothetical protein